MCLYTPPCLYTPLYICTPPICLYAPICLYTPRGIYTPQGPPCFCAPAWFWHIACCGGVVFLFYVYWDTPPLFEGPPPLLHPPTLCCWFSVHCYSQGYQFLCGPFPLLLKGLGVFPPSLGQVGVTHQ